MFGIRREINISKSYPLLSFFVINKKDKDKDKEKGNFIQLRKIKIHSQKIEMKTKESNI